MFTLRTTLLSLAALTSPALAEHLRIVWSKGDFSTISGPNGGNQNGHWSNFAIIDKNGDAIFTDAYPGGYAACQIDDGREFAIEGLCWSAPRKFLCVSNIAGNPQSCEVKDNNGNSLGKAEGNTNWDFIGIAIGSTGGCVVEIDTEDSCPAMGQDGNDLHVI
ncbi:hypothetical protein FPCIR_11099 [Fusarium pseudocircinatum]|uniref:Uncharacterized protein n=1 Tax=Fusarium pseudocircinatum TaxID=56676 RepID=A0A8H5NU85_9HYPO|nr:hypothetical protein FPCIR_11099 [Fusarium pseudocircinatum]